MLVEIYSCNLVAVFITSSDSVAEQRKKFFVFSVKLADHLERNIMSGPSQYI